ncbi:hypothetical protein CK489_29060 [Bradyrhizobium sp. UFLA03-84]|uniref:hypothetical protein n=1 Tax=Bradyrhizobium sp. UFLA03-84 TaxID=418599 RepID=UPI000BAE224A|nr:hypothetical protein [Bradyrhizobium sp. UFLA03-84]PAY05435.1 hypothetical protein CK489_29060 [Bradyrhizobium sp. UFLA03-84]
MSIGDHLTGDLTLNGEWEAVCEDLYAIFYGTFFESPVRFNGRKVICDKRKLDGSDKEEGFWHLITRKNGGVRVPDFDRSRKLAWVRIVLERSPCEGVCCFRHQEGSGKWRIYIWLENHDYLVILEELDYVYKIVTTFCIDDHNSWLRDDLAKKRLRAEII